MTSVLTRRAIALVVALILAVVAALAVLSYVRGVEGQAIAEVDAVFGYVATDAIETGTLIDTAIQQGVVEQREIPRSLLAPDAVTDLTQVTGRVVQDRIVAGDQLVLDRFAAPGQGVQVLAIPEGHQAMAVEVSVPPGVAGFLREGDHVSVIGYLDVPIPGSEVQITDPETGQVTVDTQDEARAQYLVQDVEVLAVGQRSVTTTEEGDPETVEELGSVLLTLAVTADEAERLTFGTLDGELWVTLLPEDELDPVSTQGRTARDVFDGAS